MAVQADTLKLNLHQQCVLHIHDTIWIGHPLVPHCSPVWKKQTANVTRLGTVTSTSADVGLSGQ